MLDDSCNEQIIEAFLRKNAIESAYNYMQRSVLISIERKEELLCSSITHFMPEVTEKFISSWNLKEFSPKMLKYLIRYCCIKKRIPFAYEVASLFFSKFGSSIDYATSIINTLAVYSNVNTIFSHYFPLLNAHSICIPLLAYYKILRHYIEALDCEQVSHYLDILNNLNHPIHPKLMESILDLKLSIPDTILAKSLMLLQNSPLKISDNLRLLLVKQLLLFPSNYDQCRQFVFDSSTASIQLFDVLLEFHMTNFAKEFSIEQACNIFEEICLRNIDYSNNTVNFMLSIFAKDFDIESIETFLNIFRLEESGCPFQLTSSTAELITTAFICKHEHEKANNFLQITAKDNLQLSMEIKYLLSGESKKLIEEEVIDTNASNESDPQTSNLLKDQIVSIEKSFHAYPIKRMQIVEFYIEHSLRPFNALAKWASRQLTLEKRNRFQNLLDLWGINYDAEREELITKSIEEDIECLSMMQN